MENYTIEQIRHLLNNNVLTVRFTKADGSTRVMEASTNAMYIPEREEGARDSGDAKPARTPNPDLVTCVDIEKGAWRSFRFDSLIDFAIMDKPVLVPFDEDQVAA